MSSTRGPRRPGLWLLWLFVMALAAVWLNTTMRSGEDRSLFLPGATTHGHHQIEMACNTCHGETFADRDQMQEACESCHLDQLKAAKDDHPRTKFTDPRNADRVALLDARYCVTCHVEHRPDVTGAMGVTLPQDFCFTCHADIADDRPSHAGMAFETCASAGCHNFHDNRALYEDFLAKHLDEPALKERRRRQAEPNLLEVAPVMGQYPLKQFPLQPATAADISVPDAHRDAEAVSEWLASAHAESGVTCAACHGGETDSDWVSQPDHSTCRGCHEPEVDSYLRGKHGMRLDAERLDKALSPMQPALARLPMTAAAQGQTLGCSSCHAAHRYDTQHAATEACLTCHADEHSLAFKDSPHHSAGDDGLTCAGCHMPMVTREYFWGEVYWTHANHNQSENLLPNEKMVRPVCMQCHGLQFVLDALADPAQIRRNFRGETAVHIESLELARARLARAREAKAAAARAAAAQTP